MFQQDENNPLKIVMIPEAYKKLDVRESVLYYTDDNDNKIFLLESEAEKLKEDKKIILRKYCWEYGTLEEICDAETLREFTLLSTTLLEKYGTDLRADFDTWGSDDDWSFELNFFIIRQETNKERQQRIIKAYNNMIARIENDFIAYQKLRARFDTTST